MALQRVQFRGGINKQFTPTLNEGGWSDGNLVRFRDGLPQPIGGWVRNLSSTFVGVCRKLHAWATLRSAPLIAIGTSTGLYVSQGGTVYDVMPIRYSVTLNNPFTMTGGSSAVMVAETAHGARIGDRVVFAGAAPVAGVLIDGAYTIISVPSVDSFTIMARMQGSYSAGWGAGPWGKGPWNQSRTDRAIQATSTATGGGTVQVSNILGAGMVDATYGSGWGAGAWGSGPWNKPRGRAVLSVRPRLWSIDHWGEELIAAVRDGPIFNWKPASGYDARATILSPNAPATTKAVLTGMPERHLCAYGAESGGTQDPMLVRWCDVENYTAWTATATNSAGSFRLVGGSQIMTALACQQEILVWTDAVLWAQRFEGLPYVYGFFLQGDGCGLIGPNAATVMGGVAYWMGRSSFYRYAGQVLPIACTVWDDVFRNLNQQQLDKITAGRNSSFTEVMWFYPSISSRENDRVVAVNVVDGTWWTGAISRTAWEDVGLLPYPVATDAVGGQLFQHEFGTDADDVPMNAYVESGYFDLSDGQQFMFINEIIPDFAIQSGAVEITVKGQAFPDGKQRVKGPFSVTPSTRHISARMRERQISIRLESNALGASWRLGAIRTRTAPAGSKG